MTCNEIPQNFSLVGYRTLLQRFLDAGYSFRRFTDELVDPPGAVILLRHDIEIDAYAAVAMGEVESELGVMSTYFLCPTTPFFNLFSLEVQAATRTLASLGHALGFHLEFPQNTGSAAELFWASEVRLAAWPVANATLVSVHSPPHIDADLLSRFPPLHRVYSDIVSGRIEYVSDSTGRWRFGSPLDSRAFKERRAVHLLTHPIWWTYDEPTAAAKFRAALDRVARLQQSAVSRFLPKLTVLLEERRDIVADDGPN